MQSDPLFFRLFSELPGCFFQLVGRPDRDARRYRHEAIEYKQAAVRLDGVFTPLKPGDDPAYIWEAQFYPSDKVYANLLAKMGMFLQRSNPNQDIVAVVIYPSESTEQKNLRPYRFLRESDQLVRIYLDQLPPAPPDRFDLGILELIAAKPDAALAKAQAMVPHVRESKLPSQVRRDVLQFIATVIMYQFPNWSRTEVEKMLQVTDFRQTRVYQEAFEEGIEKGLEKGRKEGREEGREEGIEVVARRMLEKGKPLTEIAEATGLTLAQIRKLRKKPQRG